MVGREDDQGVVHQAITGHEVEQAAQVIVQLGNKTLVGGSDRVDAGFAGETDAFLLLAVGLYDRMRIA